MSDKQALNNPRFFKRDRFEKANQICHQMTLSVIVQIAIHYPRKPLATT